MSKKVDRAVHGPSVKEVVLGAVLSCLLGVILGAALLILRPVVVAKEEPKEPARGVVYYIEGSRAGSSAQANAKRKAFVDGQSVTVTEQELNLLLASRTPAAPGAASKQPGSAGADDAGSNSLLTPGTPTVRIHDGVFQVGVPVTVDVLDNRKIIVQSRGDFVRAGDRFVYEPETLYLGSCPVERLPFIATYVRDTFLAAQPVPDEIKSAWANLADVTVESNALTLTMR